MGGRLERGEEGKKARELGMLSVKIPVAAVFILLKQEMSYTMASAQRTSLSRS